MNKNDKMTPEEFGKIWFTLSNAYKWFKATDKSQIDTWYEFFRTEEYETVMNSALAWIATQEKEPTIANLRRQMVKKLDDISADEAWQQVRKAVQQGIGSPYIGETKFNKLRSGMDERAFKIGTRLGWNSMAMSDVDKQGVDRAHFLRLWEYYEKDAEYKAALPQPLKEKMMEAEVKRKLLETHAARA